VTPALAEREVMMTEVTESIRKVMVRAPTPVEPTSSMVVHADGARLSDQCSTKLRKITLINYGTRDTSLGPIEPVTKTHGLPQISIVANSKPQCRPGVLTEISVSISPGLLGASAA